MNKTALYLFLLVSSISFAQDSIAEVLKTYNTERIPYISAEDLSVSDTEIILLDAREANEFEVSHLRNAIHVGYDDFDIATVTEILKDKSAKIVVYCSIGVRSEDIAEKLKQEGYTNIYNLFGGIFEWKNKENPLYNTSGQETNNVHVYSKKWGKWLLKGNKIYD
jgi:rhodanese-related sulfurtransferase